RSLDAASRQVAMCRPNGRKSLHHLQPDAGASHSWNRGAFTANHTRTERDLLGGCEVPAKAYFGVHTLRAVENFAISGTPISIYPDLIIGLACVKKAAALANHDLGLLNTERARAIAAACDEIRSGALRDQFVVDVIQGGAGTSTNMNANEVIA